MSLNVTNESIQAEMPHLTKFAKLIVFSYSSLPELILRISKLCHECRDMLKSSALLHHQTKPKGLILTTDSDSLQYLLLLV